VVPKKSFSQRALPLLIAALIGAMVASAAWIFPNRSRPVALVTAFSITGPFDLRTREAQARLTGGWQSPLFAISRDGRRLAYSAPGNSGPLYLRTLDQLVSTPVAGTEGGTAPFFSPDGEWLGFFAGGKLKKINVRDGVSVVLCDATDGFAGVWAPNDTIVFSAAAIAGMSIIPAGGGTPVKLTSPRTSERAHRYATILPGGEHAVFVVSPTAGHPGAIDVVSITSGARTRLLDRLTPEPQGVQYASTGHLVYSQGGSLLAVKFNARELKTNGQPVTVLGAVARMSSQTAAQFALSPKGTLVYIPEFRDDRRTLTWVDLHGVQEPIPFPSRPYARPRLARDGRSVAVVVNERLDEQTNLWTGDVTRFTLSRLSGASGPRLSAAWSPDSRSLAFMTASDNHVRLLQADGIGAPQSLFELQSYGALTMWSAVDGGNLLFRLRSDIWSWSQLRRLAKPLMTTPAAENAPQLSPNGRWLAYANDDEVYVQRFSRNARRTQVSIQGGEHPLWGPDSRELYYLKQGVETATMMAITLGPADSSSAVLVSPPRELFTIALDDFDLGDREGRSHDISADGKHFLMLKRQKPDEQPRFDVIVNWASRHLP